jgi:hypothetical protein
MMAWWVWIIGAVAGCIGSILMINDSPSNHLADVVQRWTTNALLAATAVLLWFIARELGVS